VNSVNKREHRHLLLTYIDKCSVEHARTLVCGTMQHACDKIVPALRTARFEHQYGYYVEFIVFVVQLF